MAAGIPCGNSPEHSRGTRPLHSDGRPSPAAASWPRLIAGAGRAARVSRRALSSPEPTVSLDEPVQGPPSTCMRFHAGDTEAAGEGRGRSFSSRQGTRGSPGAAVGRDAGTAASHGPSRRHTGRGSTGLCLPASPAGGRAQSLRCRGVRRDGPPVARLGASGHRDRGRVPGDSLRRSLPKSTTRWARLCSSLARTRMRASPTSTRVALDSHSTFALNNLCFLELSDGHSRRGATLLQARADRVTCASSPRATISPWLTCRRRCHAAEAQLLSGERTAEPAGTTSACFAWQPADIGRRLRR